MLQMNKDLYRKLKWLSANVKVVLSIFYAEFYLFVKVVIFPLYING